MRPLVRGAAASFTLICLLSASPASAQKGKTVDTSLLLTKARDIVQMLSDRLRVEIVTALKAGPASSAIGVCQTVAPGVTSSLADETGVELIRVSQKLRNPENAPDEWEEQVLQSFQAKAAAGSDVLKLEHSEVVVSPEGDKLFRYMKAIAISEPCLVCHGNDVKADVKAEIARLYPEDKALGYRLGELRGAFSLIQLIEE